MMSSTITKRRNLLSCYYCYYVTVSAVSSRNSATASSTLLHSSQPLLQSSVGTSRQVQSSLDDVPRIPQHQYHVTSRWDYKVNSPFTTRRYFSRRASFVSTFSRRGTTKPRQTVRVANDYKDSIFFRSFGFGSGNYKIVHLNSKKTTSKEQLDDIDHTTKNCAKSSPDEGFAAEHDSGNCQGEQHEEEDEEINEDDSQSYHPPNATIKSETLTYLRDVIIQYNLCPFASHPLRENNIKVATVRGSDDDFVAASIAYELAALSGEDVRGTTLLVAPEYYPDDFERYLRLVQCMEEDFMEEHKLKGIVQIAPFHPKFRFEGSEEDDVDNFTNRSPYPMFHILREDEVAIAVKRLGGDASKVWGRNVRLLNAMEEKLGRGGVERAMKGEKVDGMGELLREVKLKGYGDDDNTGDGDGKCSF
mmetsp:Transcript_29631/g.62310  ORF Transcript_29631/g.62310 Transcript_29631/m.62310 type:complete len:418 (-) Transcript_29631:48-1301(-)